MLASFLQYQVLETSALRGLTTHLNGDALHIRNPPSYESPRFNATVVKLDKPIVVKEDLFQLVGECLF